jgi:hypothetical protein
MSGVVVIVMRSGGGVIGIGIGVGEDAVNLRGPRTKTTKELRKPNCE